VTDQVARPGRPRDPEVDRRIVDAALDLFGEFGWEGFTMDRVAKRAGVGKSALYRRWSNKGDLLADAMVQIADVAAIDTGSLQNDLLVLAQQLADNYFGPRGRTLVRLGVEAKGQPDIGATYLNAVRAQVLAGRAMLRRAIARGEVAANTSHSLTVEMLHGSILSHMLSTPDELMGQVRAELPFYVEQLVGAILRSLEPPHPENGSAAQHQPGPKSGL
jgi:AcrR family transcriptional regulator